MPPYGNRMAAAASGRWTLEFKQLPAIFALRIAPMSGIKTTTGGTSGEPPARR